MTLADFLVWARLREDLPEADNFFVYEEAYELKAALLLSGLEAYFSPLYEYVYYNVALHYIIVNDYINEEGKHSELYKKYDIANKTYIVSSSSDESSSASLHITKSMQDGDFLMADLMRTPYGAYVYSLLEQMTPIAVNL